MAMPLVKGVFFINKSLLVENLHGESLIAQRTLMYLWMGKCYLKKKLQQESDAKKTREEKRKIANEIRKLMEEKRLKRMELEDMEEKIEMKISSLQKTLRK
ncbi:hypothetical protein PR048_020119 [Dryococelus australis]|uniref:Uncharacterized protein n=1 Tax=Dryococelus australis TaxID=614101 RepID=A0ABQ9H5E2_9NEOP|nr:hypothetical protein PR048_020119 [Dryococelus australis]